MSLYSDRANPPERTRTPVPRQRSDGTTDATAATERLPPDATPWSTGALRLRVRASALEAQIDLMSDEHETLLAEVETLEDTVAELQTEVTRLERALAAKDAELVAVRRQYEGILAEKNRANQQLRDATEQPTHQRSRVGRLLSRLAGVVPGL